MKSRGSYNARYHSYAEKCFARKPLGVLIARRYLMVVDSGIILVLHARRTGRSKREG